MKTSQILCSISFLLLIALFLGCDNSPEGEFLKEADKLAKSDDKIDEKEFGQLSDIVKRGTHPFFKTFKNDDGTVNPDELSAYLEDKFKKRKPPVEIVSPGSSFNIDVYLENSASMDGYVLGRTDFETSIYSMLGSIRGNSFAKSLNLNYINNEIIPVKQGAENKDLEAFIRDLEPGEFSKRGGVRGVSDIKEVVERAINGVGSDGMSIIISDFVFSPGRGVDAKQYLENQRVGLRLLFEQKLKQVPGLTIEVVQLDSQFRGVYYDRSNNKIDLFTLENQVGSALETRRPFYVWFVGTNRQIKKILAAKVIEAAGQYVKNSMAFGAVKDAKPIDFKIQQKDKLGKFELGGSTKGPIQKAEPSSDQSTNGQFAFSMLLNFNDQLQGPDFYLKPENYRVNNNFKISKLEVSKSDEQNEAGFSHRMQLLTEKLNPGMVKIEVLSVIPQWVAKSSTEDDTDMLTNDETKMKTFGLSYLIGGVWSAFFPNGEAVLNTIEIEIKR